jgi:hypothetical protein
MGLKVRGMNAVNERMIAEYPKPRVCEWWRAGECGWLTRRCISRACIWERFLKFCRSLGAESTEIPEVAARLFVESLPGGGPAQEFAKEQARMALDVFMAEMVGWSWGEDRYGRLGPKFRLKANSAGLTTENIEHTVEGLADHGVNELDSPGKSNGSRLRLGEPTPPARGPTGRERDRRASHPIPGDSLGAASPRGGRNQEALEAVRRALRVRH